MPTDPHEAAIEAACRAYLRVVITRVHPGDTVDDDRLDAIRRMGEDSGWNFALDDGIRAAIAAYEAELDQTSVRVPATPTRNQLAHGAFYLIRDAGAVTDTKIEQAKWVYRGILQRIALDQREEAELAKRPLPAPPASEG